MCHFIYKSHPLFASQNFITNSKSNTPIDKHSMTSFYQLDAIAVKVNSASYGQIRTISNDVPFLQHCIS